MSFFIFADLRECILPIGPFPHCTVPFVGLKKEKLMGHRRRHARHCVDKFEVTLAMFTRALLPFCLVNTGTYWHFPIGDNN